jgi:hypothetical protein
MRRLLQNETRCASGPALARTKTPSNRLSADSVRGRKVRTSGRGCRRVSPRTSGPRMRKRVAVVSANYGFDFFGGYASLFVIVSSWRVRPCITVARRGVRGKGDLLSCRDCMMVQEPHVLKRARLDHDPGVQEYRFGGETGVEADQRGDRSERVWKVEFYRGSSRFCTRSGRGGSVSTSPSPVGRRRCFTSVRGPRRRCTSVFGFKMRRSTSLKLAPTADDGLFPKETVVLEDDTWPPAGAGAGRGQSADPR